MSDRADNDTKNGGSSSELSEPARFEDAMDELERIVRSVESNEVDLDDLSDMVERAARLIDFCRGRLEQTESRVRKVIGALDPSKQDD